MGADDGEKIEILLIRHSRIELFMFFFRFFPLFKSTAGRPASLCHQPFSTKAAHKLFMNVHSVALAAHSNVFHIYSSDFNGFRIEKNIKTFNLNIQLKLKVILRHERERGKHFVGHSSCFRGNIIILFQTFCLIC